MTIPPRDVEAEIRERMPEYDKGHPEHGKLAAKVGSFLSNEDAVVEQLQYLNKAMRKLANSRGGTSTQFDSLLTSVLAPVEEGGGFQLITSASEPSKKRALLLTGFVKPDKFRDVLKTQQPFKDPTVPGGHGEFTHRIQWYCLMTQTNFAPRTNWADFYRWIGTQVHKPCVGEPKWKQLGLWDALFDRNKVDRPNANSPYNTDTLTDSRSPENLLEYITTRLLGTYPLLAAFLATREEKRTDSKVNSRVAKEKEPSLRDYLTKKLFGPDKTYETLTTVEQGKVDAVIQETTWDYRQP